MNTVNRPGSSTNAGQNGLLQIRDAAPSEARTVADLAIMASGNLYSYLFGEPALGVLEPIFRKPHHLYSFDKSLIATVSGQPAGMLQGFTWKQQREERIATYWLYWRQLKWRVIGVVARRTTMPRWLSIANTGEYYITSLAVYPEFRRRGVAVRLLDHAEERARAAGCGALSLAADPANEPAFRLYLKHGYTVQKESGIVKCGSLRGRICRMRKPIR
jgi:ribosomal protein S18 acetylase RimI-like enzyme